jgi:octaprenyl-diphosphate synthase
LGSILDSVQPDFDRIEEVLTRHFSSHIPFINEVCGYILFAGGKRIRPLLTLLAARLCDRNDEAVYDLGVVPEYLHAASLLHDDVVDGGQLRRGGPPAYKVWGNKAVILVGDFLYARAIELATRFGDVRIARTIAETVALMSEGEILQLLQAKDPSFDEKIYLDVIYRKTAALISASCRIGALLAGAGEAELQAVTNYGHCLGMAFQMVDDMLDYTADAGELGKSIGTDFAEGKLTLPLVAALDRASESDREVLLRMLRSGSASPEELSWVRDLLVRNGALDFTRVRAEALIGEACRGLAVFEGSATKGLLEGIAMFVLNRRK